MGKAADPIGSVIDSESGQEFVSLGPGIDTGIECMSERQVPGSFQLCTWARPPAGSPRQVSLDCSWAAGRAAYIVIC